MLLLFYTIEDCINSRIVTNKIEELSTENDLTKKFRFLFYLQKSASKSKRDELLLSSLLKIHSDNC